MGKRRRGMTLLELIVATTLMAAMVATVTVVLRTGHVAWEAQQGDAAQIMAANATVRHIVRRVRQAQAVTSITPPGSVPGKLSVLMPSGEEMVWDHDVGKTEVAFGIDTNNPKDLLSTGITEMSFTGYEADGTTETAVEEDIHSVKCQVVVELPRDANGTRTVSCWAWLRAW